MKTKQTAKGLGVSDESGTDKMKFIQTLAIQLELACFLTKFI